MQAIELLFGVAISAIEDGAFNLQVLPDLAKLALSHTSLIGKPAALTEVALHLPAFILKSAKVAHLASPIHGVVGKGAWQTWRARSRALLTRKESTAAWNLSCVLGVDCVTQSRLEAAERARIFAEGPRWASEALRLTPARLEMARGTWPYAGAAGSRFMACRSTHAFVRACHVGKLARCTALTATAFVWVEGARAAGQLCSVIFTGIMASRCTGTC